MMILSLHSQTHTIQALQSITGFLRSLMSACGEFGKLPYFGVREQGRKPSGFSWGAPLFGMIDGSNASAKDDNPADDARERCRSHCERVHT